MSWRAVGIAAAWAMAAFVFSSFVEYWGHRWMHSTNWEPGRVHREHHARGSAQGVLLEFWDYFKYGWLLMWPPFLISLPAGIGWVIGGNTFCLMSAFGHQLQHENPKKCFWMPRPVHFIHHAHHQWHHNFGMATDFWDRVFGTYKPMEWESQLRIDQAESNRHFWQINWLWGGNAEADRRLAEQHAAKTEVRRKEGTLTPALSRRERE